VNKENLQGDNIIFQQYCLLI